MIEAFIHGTVLAFGLILPLGVQNVFIFNQGAIHKNFARSIPAIVTAALCDTLLILLAVTGVSLIIFQFEWLTTLIYAIGFIFLVYMGWTILKSDSAADDQNAKAHFTPKMQITFAASVSLLNPHAIIDIIGVIGPNSLAYKGYELVVFTLSCIGISWIWFFGLAIAGRIFGKVDATGSLVKRFNQVSAFIIWGIAIYLAVKAFSG
ncbi:LysE/ArgO family amino acid transporter [Cytobacillus gottheilii]|uniref:LysE family transporter n=1 Tax=Cytobacillus gottheilii TaxID=859144 RepID=A0ABX8FFL0_9BACI|nr:LysE family transporter [Cytobacillus gottheilii]QVY62792.1 LysE family transporter [Cytobacillus gottheilii]